MEEKEVWEKIEEFPRGKRGEVYTVVRFLKNANIDFQFTKANFDISPEEPADVFVKDIDKKFQVTWGDHEVVGKLGKAESDESDEIVKFIPRNRQDMFRKCILQPVFNKCIHGKAANGIVLLVRHPFNLSPWIEQDLKHMIKAGSNFVLKKCGFDEIYLVCSEKNLLIYRNNLKN